MESIVKLNKYRQNLKYITYRETNKRSIIHGRNWEKW
jgi:hypothetical protein